MSTLAYYSTLVKKETLMDRIHLDAEELASISNDLVCEIKAASVACKNRNIEETLSAIEQSEQLIKVINAMLGNLKNNTQAYVVALTPQQEEPKEEPVEKKVETASASDKLSNLMEAIKSLKEMQQSIEVK